MYNNMALYMTFAVVTTLPWRHGVVLMLGTCHSGSQAPMSVTAAAELARQPQIRNQNGAILDSRCVLLL